MPYVFQPFERFHCFTNRVNVIWSSCAARRVLSSAARDTPVLPIVFGMQSSTCRHGLPWLSNRFSCASCLQRPQPCFLASSHLHLCFFQFLMCAVSLPAPGPCSIACTQSSCCSGGLHCISFCIVTIFLSSSGMTSFSHHGNPQRTGRLP